jgi:Na+/H+ antiporter NhaD/arsenite permease-like protein
MRACRTEPPPKGGSATVLHFTRRSSTQLEKAADPAPSDPAASISEPFRARDSQPAPQGETTSMPQLVAGPGAGSRSFSDQPSVTPRGLVLVRVVAALGILAAAAIGFLLCAADAALAAPAASGPEPINVMGIPVDFVLFGLTLLGVALFHHHTLYVALTGLAAIALYKILFTGFKFGLGLTGFFAHMTHEWVILANLFLLLMGFALLSRHFEKSNVPEVMPAILPDDWKGAFALLAIVFVMSAFLDNIAAALIGGTMAKHVFRGKVHLGYLAAIVAASNAGGSGSVVGDTTTTMMWIDGVSPLKVLDAYVAAVVALVVFGIPAALQQHRFSPISKDPAPGIHVEWTRVGIVFAILVTAIAANVLANLYFPFLLEQLPVLGLAVWAAILVTGVLRRPDWEIMPETFWGTLFLLALVTCASMMPVEKLPTASWPSTMTLGFVSAVFDNIPLTALALKQGGYDWGMLAFAVGFGGSMTWFGSSAGVALANMYPEARSVFAWVKAGWHVALAYVVGFLVLLAVLGWHPDASHKKKADTVPSAQVAVAASAR